MRVERNESDLETRHAPWVLPPPPPPAPNQSADQPQPQPQLAAAAAEQDTRQVRCSTPYTHVMASCVLCTSPVEGTGNAQSILHAAQACTDDVSLHACVYMSCVYVLCVLRFCASMQGAVFAPAPEVAPTVRPSLYSLFPDTEQDMQPTHTLSVLRNDPLAPLMPTLDTTTATGADNNDNNTNNTNSLSDENGDTRRARLLRLQSLAPPVGPPDFAVWPWQAVGLQQDAALDSSSATSSSSSDSAGAGAGAHTDGDTAAQRSDRGGTGTARGKGRGGGRGKGRGATSRAKAKGDTPQEGEEDMCVGEGEEEKKPRRARTRKSRAAKEGSAGEGQGGEAGGDEGEGEDTEPRGRGARRSRPPGYRALKASLAARGTQRSVSPHQGDPAPGSQLTHAEDHPTHTGADADAAGVPLVRTVSRQPSRALANKGARRSTRKRRAESPIEVLDSEDTDPAEGTNPHGDLTGAMGAGGVSGVTTHTQGGGAAAAAAGPSGATAGTSKPSTKQRRVGSGDQASPEPSASQRAGTTKRVGLSALGGDDSSDDDDLYRPENLDVSYTQEPTHTTQSPAQGVAPRPVLATVVPGRTGAAQDATQAAQGTLLAGIGMGTSGTMGAGAGTMGAGTTRGKTGVNRGRGLSSLFDDSDGEQDDDTQPTTHTQPTPAHNTVGGPHTGSQASTAGPSGLGTQGGVPGPGPSQVATGGDTQARGVFQPPPGARLTSRSTASRGAAGRSGDAAGAAAGAPMQASQQPAAGAGAAGATQAGTAAGASAAGGGAGQSSAAVSPPKGRVSLRALMAKKGWQ